MCDALPHLRNVTTPAVNHAGGAALRVCPACTRNTGGELATGVVRAAPTRIATPSSQPPPLPASAAAAKVVLTDFL